MTGGCETELVTLIRIVKIVINMIQIIVPVILIVMGTLDLAKAVAAGDDKVMKESTSLLAKRVIFAVAIFLVITVVKLVMNIISNNSADNANPTSQGTFMSCWEAA